MILGSLLGILGFGRISLALFPFRPGALGVGLAEIVLGTLLVLGIITPVRGRQKTPEALADQAPENTPPEHPPEDKGGKPPLS
jgi:hypothetical protein